MSEILPDSSASALDVPTSPLPLRAAFEKWAEGTRYTHEHFSRVDADEFVGHTPAREHRAAEVAVLEGVPGLLDEVERLRLLTDGEVTFRDLEVHIRNGVFDLNTVLGGDNGSHPGTRMLAALMLNVLLGDEVDPVEPPNYRSCDLRLRPGGSHEEVRVCMEVIKPGGRTSHEIRTDLEARLARYEGSDAGASSAPTTEAGQK